MNGLISNKKYEILSVVPVNQKKNSRNPTYLQVQFKVRDEFEIEGLNTNVVVAAFVTAHARLHLYNDLQKLDRRVLYFDTDSVIFTQKEN